MNSSRGPIPNVRPLVLVAEKTVPKREPLANFDVILLRQDPPFDLAYITSTHFLERLHPKTLVVNNPASVRNAPEKLFVMDFPQLMPPTLISRDRDEINAFRDKHGAVVMKPLHGHGGAAGAAFDENKIRVCTETFE